MKTPVLLVSAMDDHIALWQGTWQGMKLFGGEQRFILAESGHIAGIVNPPDANKYGFWQNDTEAASPEAWLAGASHTPGSWWPQMAAFIQSREEDPAPPCPHPERRAGSGARQLRQGPAQPGLCPDPRGGASMSTLPFEVGQKASLIKRFGAAEVEAFAGLSEDFNPLHLDPAFAATTPFERPIVHGMLLASLFSGLLGQQLPGKGTVYLGQSLAFKQPVFVGDEVTAEVEIIALRSDKPIITLATRILTATGTIAVSGEAVVKFG